MTARTATPTTGRAWAYLALALGGGVSIAANVAHVYLVTPAPDGLAVAVSVFWPVAVFVAVELLARVAWPSGRRWAALRYAGLLPVALVAAVVSYRHLSGLLAHYGEDPLTVALGPLAVDGLMVMATGALLATGRRATATAAEVTATATPASTATTATAATASASATAASTTSATAATPTTTSATGASTTSATAARPHRPRATSPRSRRTATAAPADDIAARVAALLAERPTATVEDVAEAIGRAPRTARRHVSAARAMMATAAV